MSAEVTYPYFAYGPNLNREDMRGRCPGARPHGTARLEGWRLTFRGLANIEPSEGHTVHGGLWWLGRDDAQALEACEDVRSGYRLRTIQVQTDHGPRRAITYLMDRPSYLGVPSPSHFTRIAEGFTHWGLPVEALERALRETLDELKRLGVSRYDPDGPKRLRAVLARGGTEPRQPPRPGRHDELRVWLDDDLEDRAAPDGWVHVTTAPQAIGLLDTERVVELSLDHDLGDDQRHGRGTDVVDYLAEQQEVHGRLLWPRDGITIHSGNPYGRDAMRRTIRRYASLHFNVRESLSPGGKPVFRFERPG